MGMDEQVNQDVRDFEPLVIYLGVFSRLREVRFKPRRRESYQTDPNHRAGYFSFQWNRAQVVKQRSTSSVII